MSSICKSVGVWVKARKTSGLRLWAQAEGGHTGSPWPAQTRILTQYSYQGEGGRDKSSSGSARSFELSTVDVGKAGSSEFELTSSAARHRTGPRKLVPVLQHC
jgi:hypothetical protein